MKKKINPFVNGMPCPPSPSYNIPSLPSSLLTDTPSRWMPLCVLDPIEYGECENGEKAPACCTADECGLFYGARVLVQHEVGKVSVTSSVTMDPNQAPVGTKKEVDEFLSTYQVFYEVGFTLLTLFFVEQYCPYLLVPKRPGIHGLFEPKYVPFFPSATVNKDSFYLP